MKETIGTPRTVLAVFLIAFALNFAHAAAPIERLPPRAISRVSSDRFHHGPGISSAVLSPDGRCIASAADFPSYFRYVTPKEREPHSRTIILWDADTGERIRELHAPERVSALSFSPDGKRLAASCYECVVLFDVQSGKQILKWQAEGTGQPQFSPDNKHLHLSGRKGVTSWEVASGKRIRQSKEPAGLDWIKEGEHVLDAVLSPDGKFVAWRIWKSIPFGKMAKGARPSPRIRPTILIVTDAATDKPLYRQEFSGETLSPIMFSHDGRRLVTHADEKTTVRDSATGKDLYTLKDPSAYRVAFSPNGRHLVIAGSDSSVLLWDMQNPKASRELFSGLVYINKDNLENLQCFSADGKRLLLTTDSTLRLFDTATGKERGAFRHRTPIVPRFSPDGKTLFTTCHEYRCRWRIMAGKTPALFEREARNAWEGICGNLALAHSDDGRLFVDKIEQTVRLRETKTGKVLHQLENDRWSMYFGQFSPDANRLLLHRYLNNSKEAEVRRLYDVRTGKKSGEFTRGNEIGRPTFSPDGRLIAWADKDNAIHLHDGVTGKAVQTLRSTRRLSPTEYSDAELLFSQDSQYLAITAYKNHSIWETLAVDSREVGSRLTSPTRIFHLKSGKETARFYADPQTEADASRLSCWAWSPDGHLLAVAEEDSGKVRLLEIASGKMRVELAGHRHGVRSLAFSPDGTMLATGGNDNIVFLWDVPGTRTPSARTNATKKELASWWDDLSAQDARRAGDAVTAFLRTPAQSVGFLTQRLPPIATPDEKRLRQLIADLADDSFEKRTSASDELEHLGEQAENALRRAMKDGSDLEASRRIERLLNKLGGELPKETLRAMRAIEVLEHLGTAEAIHCLKALAKGGANARETIAAKEAVSRAEPRSK